MTPDTTPPPERRWPVAVAALGLVAAVWIALEVAPGDATDGTAAMPRVTLPPTLEGFSPDLGYLPDGPGLGFVEIEAGPFTMGSDPGRDPLAFDIEWWGEGRVQGTVTLPTYYLGRFEVTVAQFATFVNATGRTRFDPRALEGAPDQPVTHVSWADAVEYARWLDGALRTWPSTPPDVAALLVDGWHVALPTEAQWEKAARGTDARIYPWGDTVRTDRAVFATTGPARVGSVPCPECAHPIADMAGNVWEWTRSPYQPYPYDDADDRGTPESDALWVMRGGSFGDPPQMIRAANRGGADPGARRPFIGFRVAIVRD